MNQYQINKRAARKAKIISWRCSTCINAPARYTRSPTANSRGDTVTVFMIVGPLSKSSKQIVLVHFAPVNTICSPGQTGDILSRATHTYRQPVFTRHDERGTTSGASLDDERGTTSGASLDDERGTTSGANYTPRTLRYPPLNIHHNNQNFYFSFPVSSTLTPPKAKKANCTKVNCTKVNCTKVNCTKADHYPSSKSYPLPLCTAPTLAVNAKPTTTARTH